MLKKEYEVIKPFTQKPWESLTFKQVKEYSKKKSEFKEMLLDKESNYGKEIVKNNLIIYGGEYYFGILGEAIENGFNGWNIFK